MERTGDVIVLKMPESIKKYQLREKQEWFESKKAFKPLLFYS